MNPCAGVLGLVSGVPSTGSFSVVNLLVRNLFKSFLDYKHGPAIAQGPSNLLMTKD